MKHYCYRHIRLDKNEPFYIGVGTKYKNNYTTTPTEYVRGYEKIGRNDIWKKIVNKADYEIEILFESDNYDEVLEKEKEFIKLYGRKNNNTGVLANMTDGGEGTLNCIPTKETRRKQSEKRKGEKNHFYGKKHTEKTKKLIGRKAKERMKHGISEETKKKLSKARKGKIYEEEERIERYGGSKKCRVAILLETGEEYYSLRDGCLKNNINYTSEKYRIYANSPLANFVFKDTLDEA